jgi:positive phototaxis protein PixI
MITQSPSLFDHDQSTATRQQYIGLNLPPDLQVMLPNANVTEVITLSSEQIVSLPETAPCLMGITNWRGEVLWLVDVGIVMGRDPLYRRSQTNTRGTFEGIVVQYQQYTVGLVVDKVTQMRQLCSNEIRPVAQERRVPTIPGVQGVWVSPTGERHWLLEPNATVQYIAQAVSGITTS